MDVVSALYRAMLAGEVRAADANSGERFMTAWCAAQNVPFHYAAARCSLLRSHGFLLQIPGT